MNRYVLYASLFIFGLVLPAMLITAWLTEPDSDSSPAVWPPVAIPQPRLPVVPLPTGTDPESIALRVAIVNGERVYQRLCYSCHGRQGKGDNNEYMASIGHRPADHSDIEAMQKLSDAEFFAALRDGVKDERGWLTMPPWESVLTSREMWDVITYVRHLPLASPARD